MRIEIDPVRNASERERLRRERGRYHRAYIADDNDANRIDPPLSVDVDISRPSANSTHPRSCFLPNRVTASEQQSTDPTID
ncbi:hypothetical protein AB0A73_13710 [Glycomyces sp. NPDC047369]